MVKTRSMSKSRTSLWSTTTKTTNSNHDLEQPADAMFHSIKIRFDKQRNQSANESEAAASAIAHDPSPLSPLPTIDSSTSTSMHAERSTTTAKTTKQSRILHIFRAVQSLLGIFGGAYAIYCIYNMHFVEREERFEVLMVRRS